jgi:hypothetical protein
MSDPAKNQCNTDPLDVSGFEALLCDDSHFPTGETQHETQADQVENHIVTGETHVILTIPEASQHLGIPLSTMYRIRHKYKTTTGADGKVRILLPRQSQSSLNESQRESGGEPVNSQARTGDYTEEDDSQEYGHENHQFGDVFLKLVNSHTEQLSAAAEQVRSANKLVEYLTRQLEEKDRQVKLLPDLQSKASEVEELRCKLAQVETELYQFKNGWWNRFSRWFVGRT